MNLVASPLAAFFSLPVPNLPTLFTYNSAPQLASRPMGLWNSL